MEVNVRRVTISVPKDIAERIDRIRGALRKKGLDFNTSAICSDRLLEVVKKMEDEEGIRSPKRKD